MKLIIPNPDSGKEFLSRSRSEILAWLAHHSCDPPQESFWDEPVGYYKPNEYIRVIVVNQGPATQYRTFVTSTPAGVDASSGASVDLPLCTMFESSGIHIVYKLYPTYQKPDPFFAERQPIGFVYTHTKGAEDHLGGMAFERIWIQLETPIELEINRNSLGVNTLQAGKGIRDSPHVQFIFSNPDKFRYYESLEQQGSYEGRIDLGAYPMQSSENGTIWEFPKYTIEIPNEVLSWM